MKRSEHVSHWEKTRKAAAAIASGLSLSGVTRTFSDRIAVNDFSFDIRPGEIISLLGPSGCGKSTLLRMIAGIDRPDAGRIVIGDVEVSSPGRFQPPEKRGVGLMFQDFALFPHLTILANVAFGFAGQLDPAPARDDALAGNIQPDGRLLPSERQQALTRRDGDGEATVRWPLRFACEGWRVQHDRSTAVVSTSRWRRHGGGGTALRRRVQLDGHRTPISTSPNER